MINLKSHYLHPSIKTCSNRKELQYIQWHLFVFFRDIYSYSSGTHDHASKLPIASSSSSTCTPTPAPSSYTSPSTTWYTFQSSINKLVLQTSRSAALFWGCIARSIYGSRSLPSAQLIENKYNLAWKGPFQLTVKFCKRDVCASMCHIYFHHVRCDYHFYLWFNFSS